jgi:hypothetical protein
MPLPHACALYTLHTSAKGCLDVHLTWFSNPSEVTQLIMYGYGASLMYVYFTDLDSYLQNRGLSYVIMAYPM